MSQRLPHTEGLTTLRFAPIQETQGIAKLLKPEDKHPALVESERVLRGLYRVIALYDQQHPGILSDAATQAVLALRAVLSRHNLAEQSIRLEIATAEIRRCGTVVDAIRVRNALAEVERFLLLSTIEENAKRS